MDEITTPFRQNRPLHLMLLWLLLVWVVTAIKPLYPIDWILENLLTYIYGALLILTHRRFKFSNTAYGLFTVFLTLHMIGAHYTYAQTPLGFWMQEWFGFSRNHYDRVVPFSYGLLLVIPMREAVVRIIGVPLRWSRFMAVVMILSFSAFYELLEMWTAIIVSPELGDAYLGTQGDVWDAQRDTFLAFAGAIVTMSLGARRRKTESA
jgi:putative membrane protein